MNSYRVLVVEDEAIVAMDIEDRLAAMGYQLAGRTDHGEEALTLVEAQRPDLILMDIRLQGDMDGITAAQQIRRRYHKPVVFLTAYSEDATLDRAKLAEPYGYILKPFDDRELKSTIEIAIHKHSAEMEIRRANRLYDVLSQVNQVVVRTRSREELFPTICRLVVERGNIDLAWIGWLDPSTSRIIPVSHFGGPSEILSEAEFYADGRSEGQGNPGRAIRGGRPFVCNECVAPDCLYPSVCAPPRFGFRSCGSFPIRFQGEVCGTLNLCLREADFFQQRQIALLEEVAQDVSFALDKIEGDARREAAEVKILRQNAVLGGINRILRKALSPHTEEELGRICLAAAEEVTGSPFGFIGEINADGRLDDIAISDSGWDECRMTPSSSAHAVPTGFKIHGIYGRVLKDGKGFFSNKPSSHPDRIGLPSGHPELHSFLGAPLVGDGRTVGMIGLANRERGYAQEELEALEAMTPAMVEALSRKRAEQGLRRSETFFSTVFQASPVAIAITRLSDYRLVDVNDAWSRLTGFSREEAIGCSPLELNLWADPEERGRLVSELQAHGRVKDFEARIMHKSGRLSSVLLFAERIELEGDGYMLSMASDITERKLAQEALRLSEARMSSIFHASPVSIAITRLRDAQIIDVNEAWLRLTGLAREEAMGRSPTQLNCWVDPGLRDHLVRRLMDQETVHDFECQFRHKSGRISDLLLSAELVELHGEPCVLSLAQDITRRKQAESEKEQLEAQLRQAQKMEALGTLAGGIAHDFNNILGIIFGYAEIARTDPEDAELVNESLGQVLNASFRARDLVQQILAFSRQGEQELRPVQVGLIVKEALKMLRASLPATIQIKYDVTSRSAVLADPTQIHQVLMNLCTNAAHAMKDEGGVLEVKLRDLRLEEKSIPPHGELQPGPHVELTVKDTGHGIGEDILERIFDPFFTTKERGVGTGLGLSVVHGIVKRHGGTISVESLPGEGATFQVFFPAIDGATDSPAAPAQPLPRGHERILVVDDEPLLVTVLKSMLEGLGYRVEYRTTGVDALEAIRHQSGDNPFDLVVTDMTMPHLSGADLAREVQRIRPGLPVILCTGFSERIDAERARTIGCQGFLMKPVSLKDLALLVRNVLDGGAGRSS
jgi:PAS domain S-box-containing protein